MAIELIFDELMRGCGPFEPHPRIVVGCSGGPDSLALAFMVDQWCRARGGAMLAVIVDHGLRPESAAEAEATRAMLHRHGLQAQIMRWTHQGIQTAIQEQARRARHALLREACQSFGAVHLALGHHRDDQFETIVMRAERDSAWPGWAGMARVQEQGAVRVLRPFLSVCKPELIAFCQRTGLAWLDDPGNLSDRFRRGLIRQHRPVWAAQGADRAVLALSDQAGLWRRAWGRALGLLALRYVVLHPGGAWQIMPGGEDEDLWPDLVARVIAAASGAAWPPGIRQILPHIADLQTMTRNGAGGGGGRTLAGAVVRPARAVMGGGLLIFREYDACVRQQIMAGAGPVLWDGRFRLAVRGAPEGAMWQALGPVGLRHVAPDSASAVLKLPKQALWAQPALWQGARCLLAPTLNMPKKGGLSVFCRYQPQTSVTEAYFPVGEPA